MAYILPHTRFGPKFKHAKGMDHFMGGIESLSTYPHYWKSSLVPHLLLGNINFPVQLSQGWTCHQSEFWHPYLGVITNGEHILMLLTPPNMLLHPSPYTEVTKQPWNPMLTSVNPVSSDVTMTQLTNPEEP